ncbi:MULTISPECIES: HlyD family secretion protein [unclassified Coleofasciculus]|uniref:HlyD family secretion protein n=1 Tax=unclassified Coleofasciculus TaxID=2692782 RepID=UPI00187DFD57|nr:MULTISPECIES: HlyD family efflux transporter periplasmic adaptor subunit [unclassified Coleofasciculus]MBE9129198.1 HlyD family efflux transporter periplasmic adaptor subunit [Coleofasciculus sp. LEGE 07081]MBE9151857.1 HlyD family efflux transporter periplasmic adaptor subunit [Coleofasciculus sp. LEGE 07092]
MNTSNHSLTPSQHLLKVVPPPTQTTTRPKPELSATQTPAKPEHQAKINVGKWILIGVIISGLGYVTFVPEFPHSVKGEADITSTSNARQDVTLEVAGVIKEIYVKPNQQVSQGQKLAQLESPDIENAIAQAQTELGKAQSALQDALRMVEDLRTKHSEMQVIEENTHQAADKLRQELAGIHQGNSVPQIQELERDIEGLQEKQKQISASLTIHQQRLETINAVNKEAGSSIISPIRIDELIDQTYSRQAELAEIASLVSRKQAQIQTFVKKLDDKLKHAQAEVKAARAARLSVEENLQAAQAVVSDRYRQIKKLEAEVQRQQSRREQLVLIADTAGTVTTEDLDLLENTWQPAGKKIIEIVDLSELTVIAKIRQEDEKFIQQQDTVKLYKQGEFQPYTTTVEAISSAVQPGENQIKPVWTVRLSIKNDDSSPMKPGMTGYVSIETRPMTLFAKLKHEVLKVFRPIFL